MKTFKDVQVGDKVRVFDVNGRRKGQPDVGCEGEVIKAGPKLVTVAYARGGTQVFRRATGVANDSYGHQSCRLPEEHAERMRRTQVITALKEEFGVTLERWSPGTWIETPALEEVLEVLRKHAVTATEEDST